MPLFFDVADTGKAFRDDEGSAPASLEVARKEALKTLGHIAKDKLPDGDRRDFTITIHDERRRPVLKAALLLRVERPN